MATEIITAKKISAALRAAGNAEIAAHAQRFFKTGKGEYGAGDKFIGVRVPVIRAQVKKCRAISHPETLKLLASKIHEERLCAVLILVDHFTRGDKNTQRQIYKAYLDNTAFINNWDLVDGSAHKIVGPWLQDKNRQPLYKLARARDLWKRRIAMMSTFHFIRQGDFNDALQLADLLIDDKEDLIHKSVGWMLREVGNRDAKVEKTFLKTRYLKMPRTMLRYAIEKFPDPERKQYLQGSV